MYVCVLCNVYCEYEVAAMDGIQNVPVLICTAHVLLLPHLSPSHYAYIYVLWTEVNYTSKIRNTKSKNPGYFDLKGLRKPRRRSLESPRLTKTFEAETSQIFTLPVAYFTCIVDLHSYLDTIMSLYSIIYTLFCIIHRDAEQDYNIWCYISKVTATRSEEIREAHHW